MGLGWRRSVSDAVYGFGPARYYQPAYRRIAQHLGLARGRVLDIGCGPGWLSVHLVQVAPQVEAMGIDRSLDMISQAQRNGGTGPNPRYLRMDAGQMSFPDGHFDLVTAVQSAHHWKDPVAVFAEVHRVLKPGGRFLVLEANRDASAVPEGWIHQVAGWPPDALVRLGWRRFGMDASEWTALMAQATESPFDRLESGTLGFYRLLEVHR